MSLTFQSTTVAFADQHGRAYRVRFSGHPRNRIVEVYRDEELIERCRHLYASTTPAHAQELLQATLERGIFSKRKSASHAASPQG